jgi:branched-chain amino acid transport system substrate-binding protein
VPLFEGVVGKAGGQMVVAPAIDRRGPAMNAAAIKQLDAAKPDAVVFLTNNAPLTPLLRDYAPRTLALPKVVVSFVDREQLLADLGKDAAGVGFSVVVPEYTREKFSVVRDFQQAARENKVAPSPVSLEGFIMGQVLLEGLRRARGDSRAQVIEAMAGLNVDLGYTQLRFTRQERAGSRYVDLSLAARGGIV